MDGRDLVRAVAELGTARGRGAWRSAWRHRRADAVALPRRGAERARVPGLLTGTEPRPGGGVLRFARSELLVRVTVGGAVFWSWDGAEPTPSYAVTGGGPEPDPRAALEADTGGGWRVVSERVTVAVSRLGAVEVRTPGGTVLRRELPRAGGSRWGRIRRRTRPGPTRAKGPEPTRATGPGRPEATGPGLAGATGPGA